MLWMTFVSFRRNLQKYSLAIISLSLAVAVSCVGLSGLDMLYRTTLAPLTFVCGGQIMIIDARTNLRPAGARVYADPLEIKPYPFMWAQELVTQVLGKDDTVQTLVAPFMRYSGTETTTFYLAARDNLPKSLSGLPLLLGERLESEGADFALLVPGKVYTGVSSSYVMGYYRMLPGQTQVLTVPRIMDVGETYDWDLASSEGHEYLVKGVYDEPSTLYPLFWTTLASLQQRVKGEQPVSWVGIPCASDQMDSLKAKLEAEITERGLPLRVLTVIDLGRMLIGDFEKFEKMADYYSPVMLFVAIQIVLVNAVAIALTRRKEMALLRTIGFSLRQIQIMFVSECFFSALVGGLLGTAMAVGMTQGGSVSYTPFILTLTTTTIVSSVTMIVLTSGSLSQTLRNPAS